MNEGLHSRLEGATVEDLVPEDFLKLLYLIPEQKTSVIMIYGFVRKRRITGCLSDLNSLFQHLDETKLLPGQVIALLLSTLQIGHLLPNRISFATRALRYIRQTWGNVSYRHIARFIALREAGEDHGTD